MSHIHAFQIEKLKNNFENIITIKREVAKIKHVVVEKLSQLKIVYNDLIKTNSKKILLFCLDSFYFQYKSFSMEMEHIDRVRLLMNNRMYCDYYKLYNIIVGYIKETRPTTAPADINEFDTKTYPVYKDLDPFQEYKLEDIKDIHRNILLLINMLYSQTDVKENDIENYNAHHRAGFSISNFLNTLGHENKQLRDQVSLYVNYLSFFHISQKKQLNRLSLRLQDFYREIEDNININRTFSIEDIGNEEHLHRFYITGEEVTIDSILEDSEFLLESSNNIIEKLELIITPKPDETKNDPPENVEVIITENPSVVLRMLGL